MRVSYGFFSLLRYEVHYLTEESLQRRDLRLPRTSKHFHVGPRESVAQVNTTGNVNNVPYENFTCYSTCKTHTYVFLTYEILHSHVK